MTSNRSYRWLLVAFAMFGLTSDLTTKYRVFRWLYNDGRPAHEGKFEAWATVEPWNADDSRVIYGGRYNFIPGWFGFTAEYLPLERRQPCDCSFRELQTWSAPEMPRVNHGALFGMGGDHEELANRVFATISILAAAGIMIWTALRGSQTDGWMCTALGLILGGTLGNLYDRIVFTGVRDFLYFYKIKWPVFNVADCCLVCGAIMLLIHAFIFPQPTLNNANETAPKV